MTHADKRMNPQHFGTDPADIRIRINPEIWIRIPDNILRLAEFACSCCHCADNLWDIFSSNARDTT